MATSAAPAPLSWSEVACCWWYNIIIVPARRIAQLLSKQRPPSWTTASSLTYLRYLFDTDYFVFFKVCVTGPSTVTCIIATETENLVAERTSSSQPLQILPTGERWDEFPQSAECPRPFESDTRMESKKFRHERTKNKPGKSPRQCRVNSRTLNRKTFSAKSVFKNPSCDSGFRWDFCLRFRIPLNSFLAFLKRLNYLFDGFRFSVLPLDGFR